MRKSRLATLEKFMTQICLQNGNCHTLNLKNAFKYFQVPSFTNLSRWFAQLVADFKTRIIWNKNGFSQGVHCKAMRTS